MSDPSLPLQAAIVAKLKAAAAVTDVVGQRVYDNVPKAAQFPYVSLGEGQVLPDKADCIDGVEIIVQVDGWSRELGFPEVKALGAAIVLALDDQSMTIDGYTVVLFQIENIHYLRDPDGVTRHAALIFRTLIQAA